MKSMRVNPATMRSLAVVRDEEIGAWIGATHRARVGDVTTKCIPVIAIRRKQPSAISDQRGVEAPTMEQHWYWSARCPASLYLLRFVVTPRWRSGTLVRPGHQRVELRSRPWLKRCRKPIARSAFLRIADIATPACPRARRTAGLRARGRDTDRGGGGRGFFSASRKVAKTQRGEAPRFLRLCHLCVFA